MVKKEIAGGIYTDFVETRGSIVKIVEEKHEVTSEIRKKKKTSKAEPA